MIALLAALLESLERESNGKIVYHSTLNITINEKFTRGI